MGLADAYQQETDQSLAAMAALPPEPPKLPAKWNGWSSVLRGPAAAVNEFAASASEIAVGTWRALRELDNQDNKAKHDQGGVSWNDENDFSKALRSGANYWRPDPATASRAEQIVFDFSRFATKAVGYTLATGTPLGGAAALGTDEAMTSAEALKVQGVDQNTRAKIGMISGVTAGAGVILPVSGSTWAQTIGLVGVGGPGAFVAQQAATKKILENANYNNLAQQYDPLDPWGLALSTLVPAGFGALGMRGAAAERRTTMEPRPFDRSADPQAQMRDKAPNFQDKPVEPMRSADAVPSDRPMDITAQDVQRHQGLAEQMRVAASQEQIDAALTHNLTLQRDVHDATPIAKVAAEVVRPVVTETTDFREWFGASKIVDEQGSPVLMYRGTTNADMSADPAGMVYVNQDPSFASIYANKDGGAVFPVYVRAENVIDTSRGQGLALLKEFNAEQGKQWFDNTAGTDRGALINWQQEQSFRHWLDSNGTKYDAIWVAESNGKASLALRNVEQLRSALMMDGQPKVAPVLETSPAIPDANPIPSEGRTVTPYLAKQAPAKLENATSESVINRLQELGATEPDMVVRISDDGKPVKLSDEIARLRSEAAEGTDAELGANDAPLVQAAANCFLATGAV